MLTVTLWRSVKDAKKYLEKYNRRVEIAIDAFYNDPHMHRSSHTSGPSTTKLNQLFDKYKGTAICAYAPRSHSPNRVTHRLVHITVDSDGDDITVDGTIRLCADLSVDPEDVVLLAVAWELKSPRLGEWTRKGWVDGWKAIGCVSCLLASPIHVVPGSLTA